MPRWELVAKRIGHWAQNQKVWGAGHVQKCWAKFIFYTASVLPDVLNIWSTDPRLH